jgi:hypothetical protein
MIRKLLEKREDDYESITDQILSLYNEKLVKALRFYMKTDRLIKIDSVEFYAKNHNFIVSFFSTPLRIGDKIKALGEYHIIDADNISTYTAESMKIVLPIKTLVDCNAIQIHKKLLFFDDFIKNIGSEVFLKCLNSGIVDLDDLVDIKTLDTTIESEESIMEKFDDLQKVQFMVFSNDQNRMLN